MANEERKREDLFIKPKRRAKNFFITSSAKMSEEKGINKTTISSSVFTEMSKSFSDGEYLLDAAIREPNASIIYMLQEMQQDLDDVYNEASASAFQASFFPFARIDSGSFGLISSSLVPGIDSKYDLGSSGKEWNDLFIDGTANIDSLAMGTTATSIKDEDNMSSDSNTSLATQQSIKKYVDDNAGGGGGVGNYDTGSHLIPHADNTYDLGSSTKEWKNLYIDGIANIDRLSADSFVKPTAPVVQTATSLKSSLVDVTGIHTLVLNSSKALSISGLAAAHEGQEITIMNIGSGAVTISRSTKASSRTIYGSSNITINQHQVYKFVCSPAQVWYAFV